jgi:PiT family inorganic phosphate transporter
LQSAITDAMDALLISVVLFCLLFDFTNGFHDTANAIATSVATGAVSPKIAVVGAAILNFLGAFISIEVAATVAKGIVSPGAITLQVVLAGIIAATIWNLLTWRFGLPTSSSHALIGGVMGAAIISAGWNVVAWGGLRNKVLLPSLAAPVLGFTVSLGVMFFLFWLIRNKIPTGKEHIFRRLQLISGSFVAFTHGTNDAQKTMGIITLALLAGHPGKSFHVPLWVILSSATAMALGTYTGGWRIIHTLGHKLVKLESPQGFAAEATTATLLGVSAHFGFPVSTTHTISGSIMGAGLADGKSKIRWKTVRDILLAWVITIPCVALLGAVMERIARATGGSIVVVAVAILIALGIVVTRNWTLESTAQLRTRLSLVQRIRKRRSRNNDQA